MMTPDVPMAIPRYAAVARQHPGLVLTCAYLAVSALGMLSSWTFYGRFGINIFHYAQLSDFILVSLRDPAAAAAILAAAPAVWLIKKFDDLLDRRVRWYKYIYGTERLRALSRTPLAWALYVSLYGYAFSLVYSDHLATQMHTGDVRAAVAELQSGHYLGGDGTRPFDTNVLGTTTDFVFFYDVASGAVTVVPFENLATLTLD